ncbi:universal stress protein [Sungkyunkwania multivorans]|uniref:Universal stress protein n=1 Tax=Sungkyunkwania multivorans TaxID=1173618 RepID=A0ABW3D148_9FLAO
MKNILLLTDFSENSWNAIEFALSYFKKARCNFYVLHVVESDVMFGADTPYVHNTGILEKAISVEARKKMEALFKRIERLPYNAKHNFISLVDSNFFLNSIKEHIEEKNIDLIVMGTKGASGLKGFVIGSNTGDVITRVKCPSLIIPEDAQYTKLKEIAFATDYNLLYNANILDTLLELSVMNKAAIRVLHVAKRNEKLSSDQIENKELLQGYFKDHEHSFHTVTNNKLEAAIECFTESRDVDMIAMVAKNINFFQQIFFRPTVETISYHTRVPFLVLHE